ncbi:MAG: type VI secretion system contractile sheath large subunit, partial [Rhodothermales bacterium]|nr:type VI secretion system contractile sheath large subunit [Rhodothermales bacterium]
IAGGPRKGHAVDKRQADALISDLDAAIASQLKTVYDHPRLRQLESSWRGLKLLVDHLDFREDITLEVLPAPQEELESALYNQVLIPEHESDRRSPLSVVMLDYEFSHGSRDIEILTDVAATAASLQVPMVGSLAPSFFGAAEPDALGRLPVLWQLLEKPEYLGWNKLRDETGAAYVSVVLPSIVLREPHKLNEKELVEASPLLGRASVAVGALLGRRYQDTGWPTRATGKSNAELVGLALGRVGGGALPLSAAIQTEKLSELDQHGIGSLSAVMNRDSVFLAYLPTLQSSPKGDAVEAQSRMDAQLFASRIGHFLLAEQQEGNLGSAQGDPVDRLVGRIVSFLGLTDTDDVGTFVSVTPVPEMDTPEAAVLAVTVAAPEAILPIEARVTVGLSIPRAEAGTR